MGVSDEERERQRERNWIFNGKFNPF